MDFRGGGAPKNNAPVRFLALLSKASSKQFLSPKASFTLAEVLTTLGIIGILAAMTLPSLISRNQNKALETALKKNYSVIQQAFEMYQAEHGERLTHQILYNGGSYLKFKDIIMPYFNVLRDCGIGAQIDKACIPYSGNGTMDNERNFKKYRTYSGNSIKRLSLFDDGQFVLMDGSLILIEYSTSLMTVDVNGYLKNPNRWGHDLFTFQLMNDGRILPMGAPDTQYADKSRYCSTTSTEQFNGIACTYYALTDKSYFNNLPR